MSEQTLVVSAAQQRLTERFLKGALGMRKSDSDSDIAQAMLLATAAFIVAGLKDGLGPEGLRYASDFFEARARQEEGRGG